MIFDTGSQHAKEMHLSFSIGVKLNKDKGKVLPNPNQYRRLVGRLLYLRLTRLDITYSMQQLSQYMQVPQKPHLDATLHVIRYLKGNSRKGLFFPTNNSFQVSTYCDSNWAAYPSFRKSLTRFCIFLGSSLIS
ncbi:hypothetical protein MANES_09G097601v8 [Manihot esculenta]|uniref:Uncharacterized protein n=1 Tax=Manihot esculenta TaxID=3983 RepID=A0ACB7H5J0_MANES|nr:hypothetical protein MANES_09G097601v8 [Manihot esculenta]